VGFYDGFFGPGTGSFLLFGFVRFFQFDFLHASAATKLVNVAVLISGGQLLKTPRLSLEQSFQVNPSKWDHDQLYLLLCNLDFVNNPDY
jgi:hypothetical protein